MRSTSFDAFERSATLAGALGDWQTIAFRERGFARRWNQPVRRTGKVCGLSEEQMLEELWEDAEAERQDAWHQEQLASITPEATKVASVVSGASCPAGMAGLKDAARTQTGERTMLKKKTKAAKDAKSSKLPIVRRGDKGMKPWTPNGAPEADAVPVEPQTAAAPAELEAAVAEPDSAPIAPAEAASDSAAPAAEAPSPAQAPESAVAAPAAAASDTKATPAKRTRKAKAPAKKKSDAEKPAGKLSCLDAAAEVLKASGQPMRCREMIDAMHTRKLWTSDAPTPHQTLASAILREITKKGAESRFRKADRGQFELAR